MCEGFVGRREGDYRQKQREYGKGRQVTFSKSINKGSDFGNKFKKLRVGKKRSWTQNKKGFNTLEKISKSGRRAPPRKGKQKIIKSEKIRF